MEKERIILGIDPGTTVLGYGIIKVVNKQPHILTLGILELHKFNDHYLKLKKIFEKIICLIDAYHPDELAIEAPFYGKNVQSMLKLGRAQGAAISACLQRSIPIFEYAPRKIKLAITGNGGSSKEQVATLLTKLLKFDNNNQYLDATDGLAAAYCHFIQRTSLQTNTKHTSWKSYINQNPKKVKN